MEWLKGADMTIDLKSIIGGIAPMLATALGGPLAGMAVKAIAGAVLGPDEVAAAQSDQSPVEALKTRVEAAISNGVADMSKLRQAEQDFQVKMAEIGFKNEADLQKIAAEDRASARTASVQGGTAKMLFWLTLFLLTICLGSEVVVLFNGYPVDIPEIVVGRILGLLDAVAMMVLSFWYGTTNANKTKDETISKLAS